MKKVVIFSSVLFYLIWNDLALGQYEPCNKDIQLIAIATPYTLKKREIQLDVLSTYTSYSFPDPRTEVVEFTIIGNLGLTSNLSLSVKAPLSWISGEPKNMGIEDVVFGFKYLIVQSNNFKFALTPNILLPTGNEQAFRGTGKINIHLDMNLGFQYKFIEIFTNIGYGKNGTIVIDKTLSPSGSHFDYVSTVQNQEHVNFSGGMTFDLNESITFLAEGVGLIVPEFSDKDFYFQLGGILQIKKSLRLKGSVGLGLPHDTRTIVDTRATLGLSFLLN